MPDSIILPEGQGFENDYDNYGRNPKRKYSTADVWWHEFAKNGKAEWKECPFKDDLLSIVNQDLDLAMVIYHFIGEHYESWLNRKDIVDLGGLSPKECLGSKYGMKRLRMLFLQAH
ncbi:MAG: hypothetical protein R3F47_08345 [Gammaproteobacteria bacterium]